jgi:hypothetical protein
MAKQVVMAHDCECKMKRKVDTYTEKECECGGGKVHKHCRTCHGLVHEVKITRVHVGKVVGKPGKEKIVKL